MVKAFFFGLLSLLVLLPDDVVLLVSTIGARRSLPDRTIFICLVL